MNSLAEEIIAGRRLGSREEALPLVEAELEALCRDITGDKAQREGMLQEFQDKNRDLTGQIAAQEERLQAIRSENEDRKAQVARINQEKLELEAQRNRADRESRDKNGELLNLEREVSVLEQKRAAAAMEEKQLLDKLWDGYELSHSAAQAVRRRQGSSRDSSRSLTGVFPAGPGSRRWRW